MGWKKWVLPLLCAMMCLINVIGLAARLSQADHGSLTGPGLMTLFWLVLTILSWRGFSAGKEKKETKERD